MKIVLDDVKFGEAIIKLATEQGEKIPGEIKSDPVIMESLGRIKELISTLPNEYQQLIYHETSRMSERLIEISFKAANTMVAEAITSVMEVYE